MIPFSKAHAYGNDFLIIEVRHVAGLPLPILTQRLCERHIGVGADGVEYLSWTGGTSAEVQLLNSDGSAAEISGNGTRCVAAYMARKNAAMQGEALTIKTDAGVRQCNVLGREENCFTISSEMGVPSVRTHVVALEDGLEVPGAVVLTGNPHFVSFVEDPDFKISGRGWKEVGREICHHHDFPRQTNVEFVHVVSAGEIQIRIFERGAGATSSSGTGSCAAAAATILLRGGERRLQVAAPGGTQQIEWSSNEAEVVLTGQAEIICFGEAF